MRPEVFAAVNSINRNTPLAKAYVDPDNAQIVLTAELYIFDELSPTSYWQLSTLWPTGRTTTTAFFRNGSAAEPCSTTMNATSSMSNTPGRLLRQFSDEIIDLAERVVLSTAIVKGQTHDFEGRQRVRVRLHDVEHLVTNNHVVQDLVEPIYVQLPGAQHAEARVVGRDPLTDLAVLRVDPQSAQPLAISPQGPGFKRTLLRIRQPFRRVPGEHQHRHRERTEAEPSHRRQTSDL